MKKHSLSPYTHVSRLPLALSHLVLNLSSNSPSSHLDLNLSSSSQAAEYLGALSVPNNLMGAVILPRHSASEKDPGIPWARCLHLPRATQSPILAPLEIP